ncbi:MAG: tRNA (N6-isopentenyl adenosine(37)-C2)-methylthiotransferase MiaB [Bacteroidota bacterium]
MENKRKLYIETYGCQMNFSDSEIVASIMTESNFEAVTEPGLADVIFLNTCSIREHAEDRVFNRLRELRSFKKKNKNLIVGVLGCMAERLKEDLLTREECVDLIAGPDSYRELPKLLENLGTGMKAVNILLSAEETYADISPVRIDSNGVSAFISIMRGCQNFCSYCVVPYTRGKERSRNPESIINEALKLFNDGYREITLLGQNVNSYRFELEGAVVDFPTLMDMMARINPLLRIRFATSHPKDISDNLLRVIASHPNICRAIHLPLQSGSNKVLGLMNRKYTVEYFLERAKTIREMIPGCALSTDIIAGFCSETEDDHRQTLEAMKNAEFEYAFMFKYSERPGTSAAGRLEDDVPETLKLSRLTEIIGLQQILSHNSNKNDIGKTFEVLVEGFSRKSKQMLSGRNSQNKVVVFKSEPRPAGSYVNVRITSCTPATLIGEAI